MEDTELKIEAVCTNLANFLKEKNRKYGDSALKPTQIFSKAANTDSITSRIDELLGRINTADTLRKNDVVDLTGYLILLLISEDWTTFEEMMDTSGST